MMLFYDETQRPSAKGMLDHEWIREGGVAGDNMIQPEVRWGPGGYVCVCGGGG